jgi:5-methylcytosine-specific restriction endonuclease McrA
VRLSDPATEAARVILRPCLDCGALIPKGRSRCATCSKPNPYGAERQRRSRLLHAAHPWCEECGATTDLTADHIVPLASGGDPLGKLRVLCRSCNSRRGGNASGPRPNDALRESEGTRRMPVRREGEGASVGDPGWELVAAGRGSAHPLRRESASSVAPRLASL